MCDPVTIATVAGVAGTLVTVAGQVQAANAAQAQGEAFARQADYQAAVAENNRIIAQRLAADAVTRGEIRAGDAAEASKQLQGRQRVAQAALGQDVGAPGSSAADLQADTAAFGRLDQLLERANAEREAMGFRTQGINFAAEADLARLRREEALATGSARQISGFLGAGGTLLTAASKSSLFGASVPTVGSTRTPPPRRF